MQRIRIVLQWIYFHTSCFQFIKDIKIRVTKWYRKSFIDNVIFQQKSEIARNLIFNPFYVFFSHNALGTEFLALTEKRIFTQSVNLSICLKFEISCIISINILKNSDINQNWGRHLAALIRVSNYYHSNFSNYLRNCQNYSSWEMNNKTCFNFVYMRF